MIAIIDYGMGNLASVEKSLNYLGFANVITQDSNEIKEASAIILPGVGSFQQGMNNLEKLQLIPILSDQVIVKKKPFLGICLGMQLLLERGSEPTKCTGLGWIKGSVNKIENREAPVPHLGWNKVYPSNDTMSSDSIDHNYYFIHSYHVTLEDDMDDISLVDYEFPMVASFRRDNIYATQFHPEKSQRAGLELLKKYFGSRA